MASVEEAQEVLKQLGMPSPQHNRMAGLTLLALCRLTPGSPWSRATRERCTVTKCVMDFLRDHYGADYAPNTRETFRRQVLHQFVREGIADSNPFDPELPTNSPYAHYAVTPTALSAVRTFNSEAWEGVSERFRQERRRHLRRRSRHEVRHRVPVQTPAGRLWQSPGRHSEVQRAVVEEFAPRFVPGAHLLYLGDTEDKELFVDTQGLTEVGIAITTHDKLPDLILHDKQRGWLLFVEAVTSHGPITEMRLNELTKLVVEDTEAGLVFVTAFPDAAEFRKHVNVIAWETEVWMVDQPDHLVHYDGDRFLGPSDRR